MTKYPEMSVAAIKALRDTNFQGGELRVTPKGKAIRFIRCGRRLEASEAYKLAIHIRAITGDDSDQVTGAHNPEFAENDYLRISTDSNTYRLICDLKS